MKKSNVAFISLLLVSFIITAVPVMFADKYVIAGICGFVGLTSLLLAERFADSLKKALLVIPVFMASNYIRYMFCFGFTPNSFLGTFILVLINSVITSLAFIADYLLVTKKNSYAGLIAFPALVTGSLMLVTALHLGDEANHAVISQLIPVIAANMSWLGVFGLTFVTMLIASVATYIVIAQENKRRLISAAVSVILIAGLLIPGAVIISNVKEADTSLRVAVVTHAYETIDDSAVEKPKSNDLTALENALKDARDGNAELLVLNEESFIIMPDEAEQKLDRIRSVIAEYGIPVLLPMRVVNDPDDPYINKVVFFDENGNTEYEYVKTSLVPFIEKGHAVQGDGKLSSFTHSFNGKEIRICSIICFDINNPYLLSNVPKDTELLIVPAWDWNNVNLEQIRTFAKSYKLNATILKHTFDGFTYVSGPKGFCGDILDFRNKTETVEFVTVPIWKK